MFKIWSAHQQPHKRHFAFKSKHGLRGWVQGKAFGKKADQRNIQTDKIKQTFPVRICSEKQSKKSALSTYVRNSRKAPELPPAPILRPPATGTGRDAPNAHAGFSGSIGRHANRPQNSIRCALQPRRSKTYFAKASSMSASLTSRGKPPT